MRKIDIAVAVFFIAVVTAFVISSVSGVVGKDEAVPESKAEIETRMVHTAAAPKAEVRTESFAVLTERATEDVQPTFTPEPEEVITEAENEPETAENAPEQETVESEPADMPETDSYSETFSPNEEASAEPEEEPVQEESQTEEEPGMEFFATCTITGYCNCVQCCGSYSGGPTASGAYPSDGWTCASNSLPLGTVIYIEGIGTRCVEDRGDSIMDGTWIDLFYSDHDSAQNVGLQYRDVYIVR